jgi:hypothetical protein
MCLSSYKSLYYFLIVRIALCLWWFGLYSWVRYQRHYHLQSLQVKIIFKHPQIVQSIWRTPWMTPCIHYLTLHIISDIMRAHPFSTHRAEPHFMLMIMRHLKWTCPHFMLMMMPLLKNPDRIVPILLFRAPNRDESHQENFSWHWKVVWINSLLLLESN